MPRRALLPSALVLLLLVVVSGVFADEAADRRLRFREAQEPLRARDWPAAAESLLAFRQQHPGSAEAAEAWVLEARARLRAGETRAALDLALRFLQDHGASTWAGRMKHTAADAYAATGSAKESAILLRELVEASTAPAARAAMAALHVKLADADFDGIETTDDLGRKVTTRNVARALKSYEHALALGLEGDEAYRVRERSALSLEELKRYPDAVRVWEGLLAEDGDEEKRPKALDERHVRWLVGRGRARLRAGRADDARKDLREALARHPKGEHHLEILLLLGEERLLHGKDDAAFAEADTWLRRAVLEHRDDERAIQAQMKLALAYQARGKSERAATEWGALVERFPDTELVPEARNLQAKALVQAGRHDDAILVWERFLAAHPNHPLWQEVKTAIVGAAFAKGQHLLDAGEGKRAVTAWRHFAQRYPTHAKAPEALLHAGRAQRAAKETTAAVELWRQIGGRYASSSQAPVAALLVAQTLEGQDGRLEDAVKAYEAVIEKHGKASQAAEASAALARLKAFHLELRMPRVTGTGAPPVVRVASRNIPALDVRVYRLEMEEYFRRKGTVRGVENLQLEVVKPDITTQWKVDPYRPFALLEADREVPVKGAGAYVVVAGDEHLTATLLFLVSDTEAVVKKARGEQLFVWAFERDDQKPVTGARILVSAGGKVREVGQTGDDGVWHGKAGADAGNVLVVATGGVASAELGAGDAVATGFTSKALVYTSAPVYRPGQEVQWRALFLRAAGGSYLPPRSQKAKVFVRDARGQTLFRNVVASSDFGTFSGSFPLDGAAPLGVWQVHLEVPRYGSWHGQFEVQEFRKPEFTLELEPGRSVYLTGEKIEATARLAYAFGGPVADADVTYEVYRFDRTFTTTTTDDYAWYFRDERKDDARRHAKQRGGTRVARGKARTDANGEAVVAFETAERDADAEYRVVVAAEDVTRRWIADEGWIPVTRRDHLAVVKADRAVYRPGEEMRIEIRTADAVERPVARNGDLLLLKLERRRVPTPKPDRRGGRVVEVRDEEVTRATYPLSTDARGAAELRLKVPGPGRWRLRWRAMDARGKLVTAYADIEATGEEIDPSRDARLVAAKSVYTEGDEAEVLLQSPVTGVTALLTYEGEAVLEHRFVDITNGSTVLGLPVSGEHAPNVFFAVAIPADGRLLEADTEVVVLRHLQVEVDVPATAGPGDEVEVRVKATDARGQPVSAEVGVQLVDETLFAVARDRTPSIRPYFYDRRRKNAVQTATSLGFQTYGTTRETNQDLLADEAARSGDLRKAMAASALQGANEALARGDVRTAAVLALRAAEADPESFQARAFLARLRESEDARKSLASRDKRLLDELERTAPVKPSATPTPGGAWSKHADVEESENADEDALDDAPFEGPSTNKMIGLGGGAGGAFGGRGGSRDLKRGGGGRRRQKETVYKGPSLTALQMRSHTVSKAQKGVAPGAFGIAEGFALESRRRFADVAAWQPRVVTGEDGTAVVTVELPDNLTTWRAVARGVSSAALVGEGRGRLVSRMDLLVRIDTPRFLVQGDDVTIPVAVHNGTGERQDVQVTVKAEGIALESTDAETLTLEAGGRGVSDRDAAAPAPGQARIQATAIGQAGGDQTEVGLTTLPRGVKVVEGRSGTIDTTAGADSGTFLEVPEGAVSGATKLAVVLYPGYDAALLDALLYLDLFPYGCIEQTVHRFSPALDAQAALRHIGSPAALRLDRLDEAVRRGALRLRNLQNDDGSFGWFRGSKGELAMTAYGLIGLARAREAGVPDLDGNIKRAADACTRLVKAGAGDAQALGHLALARVGRIETDAWATSFRRRREALSASGLAWLAMAAHTLSRGYDADELAALLSERAIVADGLVHWLGRKEDCFTGSEREATGLAVQALLLTGRARSHAERGLEWLVANRVEGGFGTTKDTAAFVGAAALWVRQAGVAQFGGTLTVRLGDAVVRTIEIAPSGLKAADRRFLVTAAKDLAPGRHRLGFRLEGQGRLRWAARLETVVGAEELTGDIHGLEASRVYLKPETAAVEGQPAPAKPGYGILREAARPRIEARTLSVVNTGDRVLVRVKLTAPRDLQYVLVEDPLPAGFEVLDGTTTGPFDWQERRDERQVFFLSTLPKGTVVLSYVLQATHWGRFTALGTTAWPMYLPEVHGRADGREITVAREPIRETDAEHGPTPDELYARARHLFGEGELDQAVRVFRELRDEQPLRDEIVEEIETFLLRAAVVREDHREIVRAREALVRRNPARIPGDWKTQRAIAFAYYQIEEFEAATTLFGDLVARGFALRVDWSRTLSRRGREVEGLDALGRSLEAFAITNGTADAALWRAQRYRELPRPDGRDGEAGLPMDTETLDALWSFTAHFAETPFADPANYALIGALRRSGDAIGAAQAAEAFLARFPGSRFEDDAWYFLAESRFRTFETDPTKKRAAAVKAAAKPLVDRKFPGRDGRPGPSEFRTRAYHLLARVAHVQGDLDEAVRLYYAARSLEDAREAYAFLTEERLDLEPVVTVGLEGRIALPVRYRNVETVAFKAYPVDLVVLFAVRKSLTRLHDVDLSGIVPVHQWTAGFADAKDHQGHEGLVTVPVKSGRPGAWLVVAKAGDHEAKTLVVKTDLKVVLQRLGEKVRVYVTDGEGKNVREAYVTVADGQRIRARGLTDGRGVFEAPGVGADAAVVVSKGERFAIAR